MVLEKKDEFYYYYGSTYSSTLITLPISRLFHYIVCFCKFTSDFWVTIDFIGAFIFLMISSWHLLDLSIR